MVNMVSVPLNYNYDHLATGHGCNIFRQTLPIMVALCFDAFNYN